MMKMLQMYGRQFGEPDILLAGSMHMFSVE